MTYTPEDLRSFADACDGEGVAAMLRAGADAMEREKQARNQALEEAAKHCDDEMRRYEDAMDKQKHSDGILRFSGLADAAERLASAIRALKEKTE
ncbi:hypothetical protein [Martelella limonii]|uniref:hypothetical protein n=1 Tax=Martelella limonii TaxID=1647649 RepID=UPI001580BC3C|nr:hypothetical protein [Martelella limonii]